MPSVKWRKFGLDLNTTPPPPPNPHPATPTPTPWTNGRHIANHILDVFSWMLLIKISLKFISEQPSIGLNNGLAPK